MVAYGIKTPPQHGPWADFLDVWRAADDIELFESAWVMDHFYPGAWSTACIAATPRSPLTQR